MAVAIGYGQTPMAGESALRKEVKEAIVTLKNNATGKTRQTTTDKEGR